MYKVSTKGQYALLTMELLAKEDRSLFIPLKKLSEEQDLSFKYLEKVLIILSKAGLVEGMRGVNGGYRLIKEPSEYTVGEILRAMEGDFSPRTSGGCNINKTSGTENFWTGFSNVINGYLDYITLDKIVTDSI